MNTLIVSCRRLPSDGAHVKRNSHTKIGINLKPNKTRGLTHGSFLVQQISGSFDIFSLIIHLFHGKLFGLMQNIDQGGIYFLPTRKRLFEYN